MASLVPRLTGRLRLSLRLFSSVPGSESQAAASAPGVRCWPVSGELAGRLSDVMMERFGAAAVVDEESSCVDVHLPPGVAAEAAESAAYQEAGGGVSIERFEMGSKDWAEEARQLMKPIWATGNVLVEPNPEDGPGCEGAEGAPHVRVRMEQGLAFGTGEHATTSLCLEELEAHASAGDACLDFGCGSGILTVAAVKLGCGHVLAVDCDAVALSATERTCKLSGVDMERVRVEECDPSSPGFPTGRFDIVLANLLEPSVVGLKEEIACSAKPGARVVLSGLLEGEQTSRALSAYEGLLEGVSVRYRSGWSVVSGRRCRPSPSGSSAS